MLVLSGLETLYQGIFILATMTQLALSAILSLVSNRTKLQISTLAWSLNALRDTAPLFHWQLGMNVLSSSLRTGQWYRS